MKRSIIAITAVLAITGMVFAGGGGQQGGGAKKTSGFKIAESTIYLTPTWQQATLGFIQERIDKYKADGTVSEFYVANANGDTSTQIAQIENLIAQKYDAIILIAGSSTALNTVVEKAHEAGIVIINIDSLVTTDELTSRIGTDSHDFGANIAQFVVDKIGGKGNVIVFNGPQGNAVAEDRRAGALDVLKKYPDIKIAAEVYSEYNEGPALDAIRPVLDANQNIDGIITLGGSQGSASLKTLQTLGRKLIPIGSENYGAYLKNWQQLNKTQGFSSFCVGQPNWLGTLGVEQAVRALKGQTVTKEVVVPLSATIITDQTIGGMDLSKLADDGYMFERLTEAQINDLLK
jgi:ribose transport system substrate-binding protein